MAKEFKKKSMTLTPEQLAKLEAEAAKPQPLVITPEKRLAWIMDPELWVKEVIKPEPSERCPTGVSGQQHEVLNGYRDLILARLHRRALLAGRDVPPLTAEEERLCRLFGISIQSGKGTGKDAVVSWMVLHFMDNMEPPNIKLMATAPTEEQLKNNLWAELYKWMRRSDYLMDTFKHTSEKVFMRKHDGKAVFASWKTCSKSADPDDQAATLAGKHEDFMMLLCDEASAIPDPVFRPIESTMTGICNFSVVFFNPTKSKGYAIKTQTTDRQNWLCYHWNAEESEVVDELHVERYAKKYGKDSNMYRINILGLPPKVDHDVLIPYEWVDQCVDVELETDVTSVRVAGLDVAGGGSDSSVLCLGTGPVMTGLFKCESMRNQQIADWVMDYWHSFDLEAIAVDVNGLGSGVAEILEDMYGVRVLWVNVGREAERILDGADNDPDRFERLRDAVWWAMRCCLQEASIQLVRNEELTGELTTIKYEDYKGALARRKVESKKEMRARGLKSPDSADAACLWNYARLKEGKRVMRNLRNERRKDRKPVIWQVA